MAGSQQSLTVRWGRCVRCWTALFCLCPVVGATAQIAASSTNTWKAALAARQAFEAEPQGQHSKAEYNQIMEAFRAIYHGNPANPFAARAVDQVAELLAEQGREFRDSKSLRAAAGQYEFLAKAYPQNSLAAPGLAQAYALLGPDAANDAPEAARVRELIETQYPKSAAARELAEMPAGKSTTARGLPETQHPKVAAARQTGVVAAAKAARVDTAETAGFAGTLGDVENRTAVAKPVIGKRALLDNGSELPGDNHVAPAVVTGIRHWSTASYTRVAIDLGGEVQFKAARVEHPDRIFFDLHGAKLAPGLAGKSFAITDDGFLKTIRAGQSAADVTRVVLDVQPVAEYSAFILPNPYRLIIDIHGKQPGTAGKLTVDAVPDAPKADKGAVGRARAESELPTVVAPTLATQTLPAPVERVGGTAARSGGSDASTLPPMPVTDGSAGFGLPPKRDAPVSLAQGVARPRVVVSAKPTTAKPVPNSVTSATPEGSREVAAVSEGPGVIEATTKPTSKPVVDRAKGKTAASGGKKASTAVEVAAAPVVPPPPTSDGQSTLMRALGLKIGRIVIDAGHGGHDSGTLGPEGIEEKDVVLDVALRLGKLLHDRLGAEIVYTRADDTFIPLETRTAIANKAQADLFISVHANSSQDPSARGVEVYYLNFTSDPEAMQVASRENAVSSQRVTQLSDLVKKIALKDKIDESRELAADVDQSLYGGLKKGNDGLKDRGVKKAPFVVLIGANMPSVLAEISFVTNPDDAAELSRPEYRERVAESLYGGVARYAGSINGARQRPRGTERAQR